MPDINTKFNQLYAYTRDYPDQVYDSFFGGFLMPKVGETYPGIEHKIAPRSNGGLRRWFMLHFRLEVEKRLQRQINRSKLKLGYNDFEIEIIPTQNHLSIDQNADFLITTKYGVATTQAHITVAYYFHHPEQQIKVRHNLRIYFNNYGRFVSYVHDHEIIGPIMLKILCRTRIVSEMIAAFKDLCRSLNDHYSQFFINTTFTPLYTEVKALPKVNSDDIFVTDATFAPRAVVVSPMSDLESVDSILNNCYKFFSAILESPEGQAPYTTFAKTFSEYIEGDSSEEMVHNIYTLLKSLLSATFPAPVISRLCIPMLGVKDYVDIKTVYAVDLLATIICDINSRTNLANAAELNADIRMSANIFKRQIKYTEVHSAAHQEFILNVDELTKLFHLRAYTIQPVLPRISPLMCTTPQP